MQISVNGKPLTLFAGATVRDALLSFKKRYLSDVESGKKRVSDPWGNERELGGELHENDSLLVK